MEDYLEPCLKPLMHSPTVLQNEDLSEKNEPTNSLIFLDVLLNLHSLHCF